MGRTYYGSVGVGDVPYLSPLSAPPSAGLASVPGIGVSFAGNNAAALVQGGWVTAQEYASSAYNLSQQFIEKLATAATDIAELPPINLDIPPISVTITPYVAPDAPTSPDMQASFPSMPAEPLLGAVLPLELGAVPTFDVDAPSVNLDIAVPSPLSAALPVEPALDAVLYPAGVSVTLPDTPSLFDIVLPSTPTLELIEFYSSHEPGDLPATPDVGLEFVEPLFDDDLMDSLKTQLAAWLAGAATGLAPDVEDALWERARVRETTNMIAATDTVMSQWSARGFALPQGAQATQMQQLAVETATKISSLSRDIAIEQAKLEQQNRHFAIEQTVKLEGELLTYANAVAQRAFEVVKTAAIVAVDLFNARVASYNASIQAYLADAQVYRARIEAETRKVELYRAEVEAQKVVGELNQQRVSLYRELVGAQMVTVELYRAQMEAAKVQADVNKVKIDAFRALIEAYVAQVQAKTAEYEQYSTRIKAEGLKVDMYKAQADAYGSVVNGYAKNAEAQIAVKNMDIRMEQELPLETYKALIAAFTQQIDGEAKRIGALSEVYKSDVQAFSAEVSGESSRIDSETKVYRAEADRLIATANVQVEAAKAELTAMTAQLNAVIEAMRAGAQVTSQIASAALSVVNLSGSVSDSNSTSTSQQTSAQAIAYNSANTNVNTSHSNSANNSASNSANNSSSQSESYSESDSHVDSAATNLNTSTETRVSTNTNYNYEYK